MPLASHPQPTEPLPSQLPLAQSTPVLLASWWLTLHPGAATSMQLQLRLRLLARYNPANAEVLFIAKVDADTAWCRYLYHHD